MTQALAEILSGGAQDITITDVGAVAVLARVHWSRYQALPEGRDQDDLQACLTWSGRLLSMAPHLVPDQVRAHLTDTPGREATTRGLALLNDYLRTRNVEQLRPALDQLRTAVEATPRGHPLRAERLSNLGLALRVRYERDRQSPDLDEAIAACREALQETPPGHPRRPTTLSVLVSALRHRWEQAGCDAELDEGITLGQEMITTTPADHPLRARRLSDLGLAQRIRYERTGRPEDLETAIALGREAVQHVPPGDPDGHRPGHLSNLGLALTALYARTGEREALDEAVALSREAISDTRPDPRLLSNLSGALKFRYEQFGCVTDLDEAVALGRQALKDTLPGHTDHPGRLSNLGTVLVALYARTGQPDVLDEAIALERQALEHTPPGHPQRHLSTLGAALRIGYERTGQPEDLDEAIALERQALKETPPGHPLRPGQLFSLGAALQTRYARTGQLLDLEEAIVLGRQAIQGPPNRPDRPNQLASLGAALQTRYRRTGQLGDLDEAITVGREALENGPIDHPDRAGRWSNLGAALQTRYARTGQLEDLDEAIAVGRKAVEATRPEPPDRPGSRAWATCLHNLGIALQSRYMRTRQLADLDEAITVGRRAFETTPTDHCERAMYASGYGQALQIQYERTSDPKDQDEAIRVCREGAETQTAPPRMRVAAAQAWGRLAMVAGDPTTGLKGYTTAIDDLMPQVVWHGLNQPTREHHLRESAGLAGEAAECAVAAGNPCRAVELLETIRSVLWTQALRLRSDLTNLAGQGQQGEALAAALQDARAVLDRPLMPGGTGAPLLDGGVPLTAAWSEAHQALTERHALEERQRAAHAWDATLERVRHLEGFEAFLGPAPLADLFPAALAGPVVIVNAGRQGGHALIIVSGTEPDRGSEVRVVDLPKATIKTTVDQANALLTAQFRSGDLTRSLLEREKDRHSVFDVLEWTWQAITEPVLQALGHITTPTGKVEDWPRLWWCPIGPMAMLPLHAAGHHPRARTQYEEMGEDAAVRNTVAGRVISSYTPSLTALSRAHARPAPPSIRQLAVGVPDAPNQVHLPAVDIELKTVAGHLPEPDAARHLLGPAATRDALLETLPGYSWLHLSCHGVQDPSDASRSAFLLHDAPLTLADLAGLELPNADLAYLAACQTVKGDVGLIDEALHLAAALQLAGYRHVLATMWNISDDAAPAMADVIYAYLCHPDPDHIDPTDRPHSARAAHALHQAVTQLRQTCPGEPLLWAPYIHLGP